MQNFLPSPTTSTQTIKTNNTIENFPQLFCFHFIITALNYFIITDNLFFFFSGNKIPRFSLLLLPWKQRFLGRPMCRWANNIFRPLGHRATKKHLLAGYNFTSSLFYFSRTRHEDVGQRLGAGLETSLLRSALPLRTHNIIGVDASFPSTRVFFLSFLWFFPSLFLSLILPFADKVTLDLLGCPWGKNLHARRFKGKHDTLYIIGKLKRCRFRKKL